MSDITIEGNKLSPDSYVELFDFDASYIGGTMSYYTNTPTGGGITPLIWRANAYYPLPFEISGVESRGDGTAQARPQIAVSNVDQFLMAAILSLGDLVGMRVTRWRTFYKYLDAANTPVPSSPNTLMYFPLETWIITKKVAQSKNGIQLEMSSPLDRPGLRLPKKQILRDGVNGFPGVARVRVR
jgi:lambda family phage minor tail protein L